MIIGQLISFLCILLTFLYVVKQRSKLVRVHTGHTQLVVGLGLTALVSLSELLFLGEEHLFDIGAQHFFDWSLLRFYAYLPGLFFVFLGVAGFMPAVSQLNDHYEAHQETEQELIRKAAELEKAKLRAEKAEAILVEALESISDAFIIFDNEDRLAAYNTRYKHLFPEVEDILEPGVTFEELIRYQAENSNVFNKQKDADSWIEKRLEEHHHPDGPKEQVFDGGRIYRLSEFKTKSGGTVAIRTEISDLRARENALILLNERLEEAQSVARIGHWSYDVRSRRHDWSDEISRVMGYVPGETVINTENYLSRVHPEDLTPMRDIVRKALDDGENYQVEYRMVHLDGTIVHVREIGRVVKSTTGATVFLRGTIQDISEEHQVERELLEAKVRAEEGTKAKSMFLANMSHELRTPLNAVIGFAEVITKEIFGPLENAKYREYSANILSSGQHLLALINDILDYSRLEAGKFDLEEDDVSLAEILDWTELLLGSQAREKSIGLKLDTSQNFILRGDERKLKQVMVNLVNNAIKFTPKNGSVNVTADNAQEDYLIINVEDTGFGIGEAELEHVMNPFVRTANSISRSIEGTGLGLPLSKSIVELHGGQLKIQSEKNKGTIVQILLPKSRLLQSDDR
jgi:PAS domain S-box-containing protein